MQFVNNHVIYHARSAFEDDDEGHHRLLLRLWLSMPNSRALPAGHEVLWPAGRPVPCVPGAGGRVAVPARGENRAPPPAPTSENQQRLSD